jgi:hypothetical protein
MALPATGWIVMLGSIAVLWGVGLVVLYRTLHDEERKLELLREQGRIDTYSPRALADLRAWIEANPNDEYVDEAKRRHDDCVEALRTVDEPFYDWSDEEIEQLETFR